MRMALGLAGLAIAGLIAFATVGAFASDGLVRLAQATSGGNGGGGPGSSSSSSGGHGGGISLPPSVSQPDAAGDAAASGACGAGLQLPDPADYAKLLDAVADVSKRTQTYIDKCDCASPACVADALDQYADALAKAAAAKPTARPERLLPRALRDLPRIVRAAAAKARAATSKKAAVAAVRVAIAEVRRTVAKTISLMRAADPDAKREATRGGGLVADTLKVAADRLARADSL